MIAKLLTTSLTLLTSIAPVDLYANCVKEQEHALHLVGVDTSWKPVTINDLPEDDRNLWKTSHPGVCPGFATIKNRGAKIVVISAAKKIGSKLTQNVYFISYSDKKVLFRLNLNSDSPYVIRREGPGYFFDMKKRKNIFVSGDVIVLEKLEVSATAIYFQNKTIKMIEMMD